MSILMGRLVVPAPLVIERHVKTEKTLISKLNTL